MPSSKKQKTLAREGTLEGIGLHTGERSRVAFKPAPPGSSVQIFKNGVRVLTGDNSSSEATVRAGQSLRCTSIGEAQNQIQTIEHLLAALAGLEITNVRIDVSGSEIPGLDGSALPFVQFLKSLGPAEQQEPREVFRLREPLFCHEEGKAIAAYPAEDFSVAYILDYPHPFLRDQKADFVVTPEVFEKEIAPARTFCTEEEAREIRKLGLGLGANFENTLVISEKGAVHNTLRFDNECARHKVLDILGDLNLLGFALEARIVAIRSGHALNHQLASAIAAQRNGTQQKRAAMSEKKANPRSKSQVLGIEEIKKFLPHRYPLLLVDRIVEMDECSAVGIKNVSANEPFFQGHFPQRAVMPGVLIVEAMAQLGGVMMLSKTANLGKMAYLVAIHNARFRKTVVPGDQLIMRVEVVKFKSKIGIVKGVAKVNGEEVCDTEIMFTLVD